VTDLRPNPLVSPHQFSPSKLGMDNAFPDDVISTTHMTRVQGWAWAKSVRKAVEDAGGHFGIVETPFFPGERMENVDPDLAVLNGAYSQFMQAIERVTGFKFDEESRQNTPGRVARMVMELIAGSEEIDQAVQRALSRTFESPKPEMIVFTDIRANSLCPHHMSPVQYSAAIGYIPEHKVIGASKFSRIVKALARRPVLQETLTSDIADVIQEGLQPKGVGVLLWGNHTCMSTRGVKDNAVMVTSAVRGVFQEEPHAKQEWLELVKMRSRGLQ